MVTKLKRLSRNSGIKFLAVILAVAGMNLFSQFVVAAGTHYLPAVFDMEEYENSRAYKNHMDSLIPDIRRFVENTRQLSEYQNGKALPQELIQNETQALMSERNYKIQQTLDAYDQLLSAARESKSNQAASLTEERDQIIAGLKKATDEKISSAPQLALETLKQNTAVYSQSMKNLSVAVFSGDQLLFTQGIPSGQDTENWIKQQRGLITQEIYSDRSSQNPTRILVAPERTQFLQDQADYAEQRSSAMAVAVPTFGGLILFLLSVVYLWSVAGLGNHHEGVRLFPTDRFPQDIAFVACVTVITLCFAGLYPLYPSQADISVFHRFLMILLVSAGTLAGLLWTSGIVRLLRSKQLLQHSICGRILLSVHHFFRNLGDAVRSGPAARHAVLLLTGYLAAAGFSGILVIAGLSFPVISLCGLSLLAALAVLAYRHLLRALLGIRTLRDATASISAGDLNCRVQEVLPGELNTIAGYLNTLTDGFHHAVQREVRGERMRSELITNVSHDLKTPLTALITYIDLLKTEGLDAPSAPEYLQILDQKSQRLRVLTEDLFDAAKASSGSLAVHLESLDLNSLLTQVLAEMDEKILASGLTFRVSQPESPLSVLADGRHLWRVCENIIGNALKYALPGSRVYVSVSRSDKEGILTMKNTSAHELNIPADELLERFTRGDASRHTEGSGLGLNIANSLMQLQNGRFLVETDGDLFKITLTLPLMPA